MLFPDMEQLADRGVPVHNVVQQSQQTIEGNAISLNGKQTTLVKPVFILSQHAFLEGVRESS